MSERYELAKAVLAQDPDELVKQHSMVELTSLFCNIVKCPTAPKFSDKKAAVKRIKQMAEEVVKTQAPVIEAPKPAEKKKAGRPRNKPREYFFASAGGRTEPKLAQQALSIVDAVTYEHSDIWLSETDVRMIIEKAADEGVLQTKQSPWRIFQYYRAQLIQRDYVRMRNVNEG